MSLAGLHVQAFWGRHLNYRGDSFFRFAVESAIEGDCPLRFGFTLKGTVPFNAFRVRGDVAGGFYTLAFTLGFSAMTLWSSSM